MGSPLAEDGLDAVCGERIGDFGTARGYRRFRCRLAGNATIWKLETIVTAITHLG
jgi:hypothetical protein